MAGLGPRLPSQSKTWMAGIKPAMTWKDWRKQIATGSGAGFDQVKSESSCPLVPVQAGTQGDELKSFSRRLWIPACAGMSGSNDGQPRTECAVIRSQSGEDRARIMRPKS